MMLTPGLRRSPSDGPRSSPDIGSSPSEDGGNDVALPDGLLPDLPPGWIMPAGKGFFPSKEVSKNITATIEQTLVKWDPAHEEEVKRLFHSKASKRLSEIFNHARKHNKRPSWIAPELWQTLLGLFDKPEEQNKR
ncbi:hypothetical protein RIF29_34420 [Crotalaria pallida]|uniref:Uncharacterized protein n=1 Tax=Crotalaria pallida TaxID=3830 RepID=A0AAN9HTC4_CROPI